MQHFYLSRSRCAKGGFSLIEIVVVLLVLSCMVSFAAPVIHGLLGSRTLGRGCTDLASFLEFARNEAMTRQTYVWVGLETEEISGRYEIVAGAVYSRDGSGNNTAAANLVALGKTVRIPHARLVSRAELGTATQNLFDRQTVGVLENADGITFTVGQGKFQSRTLTFTPGGEVLLKGGVGPDDGYDAYIDLGFRQTQGTRVTANAQEAALMVDGSNGAVKVLRVQ